MSDRDGLEVEHVDVRRPVTGLPATEDGRGRYVTYWCGRLPLGAEELTGHGVPPRVLADRLSHVIVESVADRLLGLHEEEVDHGRKPPLRPTVPLDALLAVERPLAALAATGEVPESGRPASVSVVICTRDRPADLERCLSSILRAEPSPGEVIVVDNGAEDSGRAVVERLPGVRYIREPRPGLSVARNSGVRAARGEIIAWVDDDVEVGPGWLGPLCAPFADDDVMATTGLVLAAELDTAAQVRFERAGGLNHGFRVMRFGSAFLRFAGVRAVPVWKVGAGANMAIRAEAFRRIGLFDERLGAGASGCSEDSELWYRVLAAGWRCVYEPASVVHHRHRVSDAAAHHQTRAYIRGHVSALFVQYARHHDLGNLRRVALTLPRHLTVALGRQYARQLLGALGCWPALPDSHITEQVRGYLGGLRYLTYMLKPGPPNGKASRRAFLRQNPYPRPLLDGFFYREKMRAIHRVAPDVPVGNVLDVGGGRSGLARMLYPEADVTVLDADPQHDSSPMNQVPGTSFVHGDATALPFPDASFDVVTMFDLLEHVEDDRAAAAEALRVLRPGGHVLVSSPNLRWRSPYHRVMRPICPTDEDMMRRWGHVRRGYDLEGLSALFGAPPEHRADFINRLTVVGHDVAFSKLPAVVRRGLLVALAPVTWLGYLAQAPRAPGTETAARWRAT